jgi:hypothetical protein
MKSFRANGHLNTRTPFARRPTRVTAKQSDESSSPHRSPVFLLPHREDQGGIAHRCCLHRSDPFHRPL